MRQGWIVLGLALVAVGMSGCAEDGIPRASSCYPGIPVVTPASAPAGSVVSVSGPGFGDCDGADRHRTYELRMYAIPQYGIDERGRLLGPVEVDRARGTFTASIVIPADAVPGDRYVGYGRHRGDEPQDCEDGGGCTGPPPNLTVTGPP